MTLGLHTRCGPWSGPAQTWADPSGVPDCSTWHGTIRSILGGRFVVHEYTGTVGGKPHEGHMLFEALRGSGFLLLSDEQWPSVSGMVVLPWLQARKSPGRTSRA